MRMTGLTHLFNALFFLVDFLVVDNFLGDFLFGESLKPFFLLCLLGGDGEDFSRLLFSFVAFPLLAVARSFLGVDGEVFSAAFPFLAVAAGTLSFAVPLRFSIVLVCPFCWALFPSS